MWMLTILAGALAFGGEEDKKPVAKPAPKAASKTEAKAESKTQAESKTPAKTEEKTEVKAPAVRRASIPVPRPRRMDLPSYRVSIKLKNGRRFTGVVCRDRRFNERVRERAHLGEDIYQTNERFLLSYVDNLDGTVVLTWDKIKKLEVRESFDLAGLKSMERSAYQARVARLDALAARRAAEAAAADAEQAEDAEEARKQADEAAAEEVSEPVRPELLVQFPPEEGWNAERKEQIEWRRLILDVMPDAREASFLEIYPRWEPAFEEWQVAQRAWEQAQQEREAGDDEAAPEDKSSKAKAKKGVRDRAGDGEEKSRPAPKDTRRGPPEDAEPADG